jgi:hypothetical protein
MVIALFFKKIPALNFSSMMRSNVRRFVVVLVAAVVVVSFNFGSMVGGNFLSSTIKYHDASFL